MRHAEQSADPEPVLTEAGQRRATALVRASMTQDHRHLRDEHAVDPQETAEPTANALGITHTVVPRQEIEGLVARVRAEPRQERVLIVNHSLNVPGLLKAFGHPEGIRVALDDYEPLFVIVPRADGPPIEVFLRL